jgi:LysM repeat protein
LGDSTLTRIRLPQDRRPNRQPSVKQVTFVLVGFAALVLVFALFLTVLAFINRPTTQVASATQQTALALAVTATLQSQPIQPSEALPSATSTPLASSTPPTATQSLASPTPFFYTVQEGDTLLAIADGFGMTSQQLLAANPSIANPDALTIGQQLLIPSLSELSSASQGGVITSPSPANTTPIGFASPTLPQLSTPAPQLPNGGSQPGTLSAERPAPPNWSASLLPTGGNVSENYPLTTNIGQITIHYQPDTYPATHIDLLTNEISQIWDFVQTQLGGTVQRPIDVYLAGTWFANSPALQGTTYSNDYKTFILVDGAYSAGETSYILAHELTHMAATHIFGFRSSVMLHEGLAVAVPQRYLEKQGYLPMQEMCGLMVGTPAFSPASRLVRLGYGDTTFGGHIRTFANYVLSGCFVQYLIDSYGMQNLANVYNTGNYDAVYGLSLDSLSANWQATLTSSSGLDGSTFVTRQQEIAQAYEVFFATSGVAQWDAYLDLVARRTALNQGDFAP